MRDINDFMPQVPNMRWGVLTNQILNNAKLRYLKRIMPVDRRWHTLFEDENATYFDDIEIRKKTLESLT